MGVATKLWPEERATPALLFEQAEAGASPRDLVVIDPRFQRDPLLWVTDVMGVPRATLEWSKLPGYERHKWDGTKDPLALVLRELAQGRDIGVESATGTGKTFTGALTALWFLANFEDALVVTIAPKEKQLELHLWKEIGRLWDRFVRHHARAKLTSLRVRMRPDADDRDVWSAIGYACGVDAGSESATRLQGFHAEHMLFITEETPGIQDAVMEAIENTATGDHNLRLAFGNPDHQHDPLHKFATSPGVTHVRISALDHPNVVTGEEVIKGAVGRKAIERRRLKYGEQGRLYLSRVRGLSPAEAVDALIRWAWCKAAANRADDPALRKGKGALGVDVANSENGDLAAIAVGKGRVLLEVRSFPCPDSNQLGVRVLAEMGAARIDASNVGVDAVGVGAGTVNTLRGAGERAVRGLNGGSAATQADEEKFANLRAQMWWQLRLDLQNGVIALPDDEELFADLTTPTWETRGGQILVESKEAIRKRLGRSPDKGDAAVYWNWVRDRSREPEPERWDENRHPGYTKRMERRRPDRVVLEADDAIAVPRAGFHMPRPGDYEEED